METFVSLRCQVEIRWWEWDWLGVGWSMIVILQLRGKTSETTPLRIATSASTQDITKITKLRNFCHYVGVQEVWRAHLHAQLWSEFNDWSMSGTDQHRKLQRWSVWTDFAWPQTKLFEEEMFATKKLPCKKNDCTNIAEPDLTDMHVIYIVHNIPLSNT